MITAFELGQKYADISDDSFLAHTIRKIEEDIFMRGRQHKTENINFKIQTRISDYLVNKSACRFYLSGCTIYLPLGSSKDEKLDTRIWLAHELGHIVKYIPYFAGESSNAPPVTYPAHEEAEAWEFARSLLWHKSEFHKSNEYEAYKYSNLDAVAIPIIRLLKYHGGEKVKEILKARKFSKHL